MTRFFQRNFKVFTIWACMLAGAYLLFGKLGLGIVFLFIALMQLL